MKYYYQFSVWKNDYSPFNGSVERRYCTTYTVESDRIYDNRSLNYIASHVVVGERVMLFVYTYITHVVVSELRDGFWFDEDTITHTLLPSRMLTHEDYYSVSGARPGPWSDSWYGLMWKRNSKIGESYIGYFPACVGMDDCVSRVHYTNKKRSYYLSTKGPLAVDCWPFYSQMLAYFPQIQDRVTSDRFGQMWLNVQQTSGRKMSHVSDMQRNRSFEKKSGVKTRYVEKCLSFATVKHIFALARYYGAMDSFDHRWGDAKLPFELGALEQFIEVSSVWLPLMKSLGIDTTFTKRGRAVDYFNYGVAPDFSTVGYVRIKRNYRQVYNCLVALMNCHQWLCYLRGVDHTPNQFVGWFYWWRDTHHNNDQTLADAIYADWNLVTDCYFKIGDCINVLNSIVLVDEPKNVAAATNKVSHPKFDLIKRVPVTMPGSVPFTAIIEVYPVDRDPYLFTPPPIPVERDEIPVEEDIPWDSGTGGTGGEADDENYQQAMRNAVRTALAKLEFTRRWIGKIRKQFILYRNLAIEKFAPQNDESQNPLGQPIDPPKIIP
jgi:hypothetical protein